jgi:hypothetical protein
MIHVHKLAFQVLIKPQRESLMQIFCREMSETCIREKERLFIGDTLADLDLGGSCSSTWTLALGGP